MAEAVLSITFDPKRPMELADLAASFGALSKEYKLWLDENEAGHVANDVTLCVKELRTGSIVADIVALSPLALPFMENTKTVIEFGKYLKVAYDALLARRADAHLPRHTYENLSCFVEPVAKDNGSQVNVSTVINGNVSLHLHLGSVEANAVQNAARHEMASAKTSVTGLHEQVVLYLYQARNDAKSSAGDRAVIESIHPGPVKLVFNEDGQKAAILAASDNPFQHAYLVDVMVETIGGRPVLYKVVQLRDTMDRPEAA